MNGEIIQYKIADISPSLPFRLKITEIWECVKYKIAIFRFCEMLYLCYVCVLRYVLCLCYVCVLCFVFCALCFVYFQMIQHYFLFVKYSMDLFAIYYI